MDGLTLDPDRFATKADIVVLEANLRGEMKGLNSELLRTLFFGMLASNATLVALAFAAARLA